MAADKKGAEQRGDRLGFWDESGFSERPSVRCTWAPSGKTPVIRGSGSWKKRTAIGVITATPDGAEPEFYLRISARNMGSDDMPAAIEALRREVRGTLTLVWDRLTAHVSKATREFLKGERDWLRVYHFPPCAPELDPVEYLWSPAKTSDLANLSVDTVKAIDTHLRGYKRRIDRRPDILTGCLKKSSLFDKELSS